MRIAITGASGMIGSALSALLEAEGHEVLALSRASSGGRASGPGTIAWDPERGTVDTEALGGVDAVVHLAGENVGARWTPSRKRRIRESREKGTLTIARALAALEPKPRCFVSASAIGIYGDRGDELLDEGASRGEGFLAGVCEAWEQATAPAREAGIRTALARIGIVMAASGGALSKMLPPFRLGLGGPIGDGKQYVAWIDLGDAVRAISYLLTHEELEGPFNLCAPNPVQNAELSKTLGKVLRRPAVVPAPRFALRLALGEMADETVLASQRATPRRLLGAGFRFEHEDLEGCLRAHL